MRTKDFFLMAYFPFAFLFLTPSSSPPVAKCPTSVTLPCCRRAMAEQEEAVRRSAVSWEETKGFLIIGLVGIQTIVCWGRRGDVLFLAAPRNFCRRCATIMPSMLQRASRLPQAVDNPETLRVGTTSGPLGCPPPGSFRLRERVRLLPGSDQAPRGQAPKADRPDQEGSL